MAESPRAAGDQGDAPSWRDARIASFDLETTGTDPETARIIEIGVATFQAGELVERYQQLVDPGVPIPEKVQEITGISDEDVQGQPTFDEVVEETLQRLDADVLLAYNRKFDLGMLAAELERVDRQIELPECLDPFPFVWVHLREAGRTTNAQLSTAAAYFDIALDDAHRADADAIAAGEVMLALPGAVELPPTLRELLDLQAVLEQQVEATFARFRRNREGGSERSVLSGDAPAIELGAAYVYGKEPDPVRALFSRIPDVRDMT